MSNTRYSFLNDEGPAVKHCSKCGRRIPLSSPYDQCKECMKKNYDVNEMIVAQEFGIDRSIIHEWVRDGHLEYKTRPQL